MTVQAFLIYTPEQAAQAVADSAFTDFKVYPRVIDNPLADQLGDPIVVVGNFITNTLVIQGPEYGPYWYDKLSGLPIRILDTDVIFLPPIV